VHGSCTYARQFNSTQLKKLEPDPVKPVRYRETAHRGFVDGGPVLQAYLRYQEKVGDGTFREGGEIPLNEIM
jgi:hypothetical protein